MVFPRRLEKWVHETITRLAVNDQESIKVEYLLIGERVGNLRSTGVKPAANSNDECKQQIKEKSNVNV